MKRLNEAFTEDVFERLQDVKGERTWNRAIQEEFGVWDDE